MLRNGHPDEDVLERYARNTLREAEAETIEDHIALCTYCLDRLDETAAFVSGMRHALDTPRAPEKKPLPWWKMLWGSRVAWAAGAAFAGILLFVSLRSAPLAPLAGVVLESTRGPAKVVHGTGPFDFELVMPELLNGASPRHYHLALVDSTGDKKWEGDAPGQNGKLHALVKRRLAAGQYFVRVTDVATHAEQDFGVSVEP